MPKETAVMFVVTKERSGSLEEICRRLTVAGLAACLYIAASLLWAPAAPAATNNIFTVAGSGTQQGFSGDGGPATAAQLNGPQGIAATADGGYLIADFSNHRVRRVSPAGIITTVAGTGTAGFSGDNGPASMAQLNSPSGVATTGDGGFLIVDQGSQRVRRVSPAGIITTVAGNGSGGFSGDGGPATEAQLSEPEAVAVTADGGFLIADSFNHRVRRVSPAGIISTVAGDGDPGFSGDGGPATMAQLQTPQGVAATADGGFLIADRDNFRVRRVSPTGTITTVAGNGTVGTSGDGGPAVAAGLTGAIDVAVTADGGFLLAEPLGNVVRRVSPTGTITTVAGNGSAGFSGDGGSATAAQLNLPAGVAATADGGFLIADSGSNRVRFVDADLRFPRGAQGPAGPTGAQGPAGPAGPVGRAPLALALADSRLRVRARRMVTLRYAASEHASVLVRVMRGRRTLSRARDRARHGANSIRLRAPGRAGRYRLRLEARTDDGRTARARAVLIVR
jgi:NHL repeat